MEKRKIVFIINGSRPVSRENRHLIEDVKAHKAFEVEILTTRTERDAIELARAAAASAWCIVAVGGDGTCNEVVNGMMQAKSTAIFGIIPNGTGNDYQRSLGIWNAKIWLEALNNERYNAVDLCQVRHENETRYALNIAGCGFDGFVVNLLNRQREKWKVKGKIGYATAIARAFFLYRKRHIEVRSKEFNFSGKALMVVACKGKVFGHGLTIAPDASLNSGRLHMVVLGKVSLLDYVRNLGRLKRGFKIEHPEAHYFSSEKVEVRTNHLLYSENDGEQGEVGSLVFSLVPACLKVLQLTEE